MNCKPGDLAIITHARGSLKGTGANVGRIVRVVRPHGDVTTAQGDTFFCWWVEFAGSPGKDADHQIAKDGHFPDAYLRPINPPSETIERHEELALQS